VNLKIQRTGCFGLEPAVDKSISAGWWREPATRREQGKAGRIRVREGGGAERAGGAGRNGQRAPREQPGAWGWVVKVGPDCLPARLVTGGLHRQWTRALPAALARLGRHRWHLGRLGAGKAWTGASCWLEALCTRCTVFLYGRQQSIGERVAIRVDWQTGWGYSAAGETGTRSGRSSVWETRTGVELPQSGDDAPYGARPPLQVGEWAPAKVENAATSAQPRRRKARPGRPNHDHGDSSSFPLSSYVFLSCNY
jgi:hypothetical protein